ncbi:7-carboxy-7-deazaguanine synthase QueE [Rhodococcus sp. IEGM 1318]|uniref:7-carboxy-7-deazaguanine synthase QueE n=1 Tax=Rhodococcus sp. IEGM 1318 TaxID=3082226 RepID=UPI002954ADC5|nr:7-carboxy-7-deazaguanine synthase QueE [Rhodococcus sp. IEGM 1318]MDV8008956.1 7-carboxy-7-deazaguanine synthase QueE [Rhodococcus sp. IEGM 1318]
MTDPIDHVVQSAEPVLRIVEIFGPTLQGEGVHVGRAAHFLRLAGCNLSCRWCDTAFSWDPAKVDPERPPRTLTTQAILEQLEPRVVNPNEVAPVIRHLVVTGGEPLLQSNMLIELCRQLREFGWFIEIETSGSVSLGALGEVIDQCNVSPKLKHSGVAHRARLRYSVLNEFAGMESVAFKFVVQKPEDLDEIDELLAALSRPIHPSQMWVMAEGNASDVILERSRLLVDEVIARGWGLTPRWHTLLWNDEQGR